MTEQADPGEPERINGEEVVRVPRLDDLLEEKVPGFKEMDSERRLVAKLSLIVADVDLMGMFSPPLFTDVIMDLARDYMIHPNMAYILLSAADKSRRVYAEDLAQRAEMRLVEHPDSYEFRPYTDKNSEN